MTAPQARRARHEPVQVRAKRTRIKVLAAARKVLIRRGYESARVEEITRIAKVGYGTFYKYFRNKKDVLEAVMEDIYLQLTETGFPAGLTNHHSQDPLRSSISNYLKVYHLNREVLLALQPASMTSPRIRRMLAEKRENDILRLVDDMRTIRDQGQEIQGNPEILSIAMLEAVDSVARDWITGRQKIPIEEVTDTLCHIWLRVFPPHPRSSRSPKN